MAMKHPSVMEKDGQVEEICYADGRTVSLTYNAIRQLEEVKDWLGTTRIAVDEAGRVSSVTDPYGKTVGYEWGSMGERTSVLYPDGRKAAYEYNEAMQLLADERAPFFFGLSIVCQFASTYFNGDTADDLGFIPFPSGNSDIPYPTYSLGGTATFSINANSKYKDECAAILDRMMNNDFMNDMTESWPGYWGIPLKDPQFDMDRMEGLSVGFL